jgi:UrcA family protein
MQETTMNTSTRLPRIAATIVTALTGNIAVSFASDAPGALQVKVNYADLDVSSASGAATLYKRILGAAETVCEPLKSPDLYLRKFFYVCLQRAMSDAINGVNQPALFAIARAKAGAMNPNLILTSNAK